MHFLPSHQVIIQPVSRCRCGITAKHCMLSFRAFLFLSCIQLSQHTKTHLIDTDMQSTVSHRGDTRDGDPDSINLEWPICTGYLDTAPIHTNSSSTVSMSCCADTNHIEPDTINPEWPICTGYLDTTLAIFKRHKHPFILISTLANRWSGANNLDQDEIDILVRSSQTDAIVQDLVASGEWKLSTNYADTEGNNFKPSMISCSHTCDIWLETCIEDPWFHYLRPWPEKLYKLSIDCGKIEVPDVQNTQTVLVEEEYFRDPHSRFGPVPSSKVDRSPVPRLQVRAKFRQMDIPIFVPTIEDHLNAYLDQRRAEIDTGLSNGGIPEWQIHNFIRYLYLDWAPTREWLMATKIRERNQELMGIRIDKYRRKLLILWDHVLKEPVYDKMPWELAIRT